MIRGVDENFPLRSVAATYENIFLRASSCFPPLDAAQSAPGWRPSAMTRLLPFLLFTVLASSCILATSPASVAPLPAAPMPGGGRIVFDRPDYHLQRTHFHIWLINADGSNLIQLTNAGERRDVRPVLSHDGRKIAFVSQRDGEDMSHLCIMNDDGTGLITVSNTPPNVDSVDWSPDDGRLLLWGGAGPGIYKDMYLMSVDGSGLTKLGPRLRSESPPRFGPDGKRILFSSPEWPEKICIANLDGSGLVKLPNKGDNSSPAWSPDGERLLCFSRPDEQPEPLGSHDLPSSMDPGLQMMTPSGEVLFFWHGGPEKRIASCGDWSPNGSQVVFAGGWTIWKGGLGTEQGGLYVMGRDGGGLRFLTDGGEPRWGVGGVERSTALPTYRQAAVWGGSGHGPGKFCAPCGLAVDQQGYVYVVEYENDRVQKFRPDGSFIRMWGRSGKDHGQFANPAAVAVDSKGNVYVVDSSNDRIQKFGADGKFIIAWSGPVSGHTRFTDPSGVAIDSADNVYVVTDWSHRIWKFTADGRFLSSWSSGPDPTGEADFPTGSRGIAVDRSGNVYVLNIEQKRIEKFTPDQKLAATWDDGGECVSLAVDAEGTLYVGNDQGSCVEILSREGLPLGKLSTGGSPCSFDDPGAIAFAPDGSVYVAENRGCRVTRLIRVSTNPDQNSAP